MLIDKVLTKTYAKPKITTAQFSRRHVSTDSAGTVCYIGSCIIQHSLACCEIIKKIIRQFKRLRKEIAIERTCFLWMHESHQCDCDLNPCNMFPSWYETALFWRAIKWTIASLPQITASSGAEELRNVCSIKFLNVAKPAKPFTPSPAYCIMITWDN